jgi:hypothetical protein
MTKTNRSAVVSFIRKFIILAGMVTLLIACSSPERQKNKAEARHTEEKTKTMQEYKSCIKKAKEDQPKIDACERLLKANE